MENKQLTRIDWREEAAKHPTWFVAVIVKRFDTGRDYRRMWDYLEMGVGTTAAREALIAKVGVVQALHVLAQIGEDL